LVTVAGITPTGYNGTFVLTAVASTTISYANATIGSQTVAGTVSVPAQKSITARSAGTKALVLKGTVGGANIFEAQDIAGVVTSFIDSNSNMVMGRLRLHNGTVAVNTGARLLVETYAAQTATIFKGAASQTANLTEWQDSAGTIMARVNNIGEIVTSTTVYANGITNNTGYWSINNNGVGQITARAATNIPLTLKGAASQTANLQEWQDSSAVVKLAVRPDGITKHATTNTATTVGATGTASALPALPVGYLQIDVNGTLYKMPYYNN
jgi:hypothetical protein